MNHKKLHNACPNPYRSATISKLAHVKSRWLVSAVFALCFILSLTRNAAAQQLIYSDDFSSTNALWTFAFDETQNNSTAIAASYAKIQDGTLQLKANVGCGWDYLWSIATLNLCLPSESLLSD